MADNFTLPLAVSTALPTLLAVVPLALVLTVLSIPTLRNKYLSSNLALPSFPASKAGNDHNIPSSTNRNGSNKASKSSLNLRPLLLGNKAKMVRREDFGMPPRPSEESETGFRAIFRGSQEPRKASRKPQDEEEHASSDGQGRWVQPYIGMIVAGLITVVSGVLYLALLDSGSPKALDIALAMSITSLPFMAVTLAAPYAIASLAKVSPRILIIASLAISLGISCLGAFVSLYIPLAISGACLVVLTAVILKKSGIVRRLLGKNRIELPADGKERKRSPANGVQVEEEIEEMQSNNSWLAERGESGSHMFGLCCCED
jgi:hypothetical protein